MTASPTPIREPYDPARHLSRVNGNAYLEVDQRVAWFRDRYPDGQTMTEMIDHGPDWAIFRAEVTAIAEGGVVCGRATGHGSETAGDFRDYIEKAETKALGRALAALGFGTQFVVNHEGAAPRVVDAPVAIRKPAPAPAPPAPLPINERQAAGPARPAAAPSPTPAVPLAASNPEQRATARQLAYLRAVARDAGYEGLALVEFARQEFGAAPDDLSRRDGSALIELLQGMAQTQ